MKVFRNLKGTHSGSILTIGNYDGIHLGHLEILNKLILEAKKTNLLSSVMTFEPHPKEFFFPKDAPARIISIREKLEYFEEKRIDQVFIIKFNHEFSSLTSTQFIDILKNNIQAKQVIIGNDFRFGARREGDVKSLMKDGINVCVMEKIQDNGERISSTMVRDLLANGDLERATNILGRPYAISGKVVHGDKRGRELGFPTANIHMFHNRPPLKGVFAVKLNGMSGVANLGTRPTITGISKLNLEVHLFDFSEDLYGKHAKVIFLQKVRDEKKFRNIEALKEQIKIDIKKAKIFLEDYDRRQ